MLARARVLRAEGQRDEAAQALAAALLATTDSAVRALCLAELAEACEVQGDLPRALESGLQALAVTDAFATLAPWYGERDFRARLEARVGGLLMALEQPERARTFMVAALERAQAANSAMVAARVMANLGALSVQRAALTEAAHWFSTAAAAAERGGDFLFQARQLVSLTMALARLQDDRLEGVAAAAVGLARAVGLQEEVAALESVLERARA